MKDNAYAALVSANTNIGKLCPRCQRGGFSALAFQDCSPYFHHWMPRFASYRSYVAQSFPMLVPDTHAVRVTGNFKAALEAYHSPASPVRFRGLRQAQAWPIFPFRVCL